MKIYQKTYIVLGVGAVVLWLLIQFVYVPKLTQIKKLRTSLKKNKERNVRINDLGEDKDFFEDLMTKVNLYHSEVKSLMPKQIKLSGLLRELSILAKKNDVTLLSIRPLENTEIGESAPAQEAAEDLPGHYVSADIEIILECRYENLGRYVQAVENNSLTVMAIEDIHIKTDEKIDDPSRLKVILVIEAFYKGD